MGNSTTNLYKVKNTNCQQKNLEEKIYGDPDSRLLGSRSSISRQYC